MSDIDLEQLDMFGSAPPGLPAALPDNNAGLPQHPLSAMFPPMTDAAFAELRADIAQKGLDHPVVLFQDAVLDGWHRYQACRQAGVPLRFEQFDGDDGAALKYVISANLLRRHLNESQRGMIAARLAQLPAHRPERRTNWSTYLPVAAAAELLNVGEQTVKRARTVLDAGNAETVASVERGDVAVSRAAKDVRAARPKPVRQAALPELENPVVPVIVEQWKALSAAEQQRYCTHRNPKATLNLQKEGEDENLIDWAFRSWNWITGCLHACPYCYARDVAERFDGTPAFPNGFVPTFRADRLSAPLNQRPRQSDDLRERCIFAGSMADIFGRWVPEEWIEAGLQIMREATQWEFLLLTKFPKRMVDFDFPDNAWIGTTVDCQARVAAAEAAFANIRGGKVRWLSCEPLIEPLKFNRLDLFDRIVIGGASPSTKTPRWIPPFSWLDDLNRQANEAGCLIYMKSNLLLKETPGGPRYQFTDRAPEPFHYLAKASTDDQRVAPMPAATVAQPAAPPAPRLAWVGKSALAASCPAGAYVILPPGRRPFRPAAKTFAVMVIERQKLAMRAAHWLPVLAQPSRETTYQLLARVDEFGRSLGEAQTVGEARAVAEADHARR